MQTNSTTSRYKGAIIIALALAIVALPAVTQADTIRIRREYYGAGRTMEVWGAGEHFNTHSGVRMLKKTSGTGEGNLWLNGLIPSFCIELSENTSTSYRTYDVVQVATANNPLYDGTSLGALKQAYLGVLINEHWDEAWGTGSPWTSSQRTRAAAFQLAVWEIVYEHEFLGANPVWDVKTVDWSGDNDWYFKADGNNTVENKANTWLASLDPTHPVPGNLRAFTYNGHQDYIVPEPATMGLLAFGGIAALLKRRRTN
jgi:hypothetical protein